MKKIIFNLSIFLFLLNSCGDSIDQKKCESILKTSSLADSILMNRNSDSLDIQLWYQVQPSVTSDYLSSIVALSLYDTMKKQLKSSKIENLKMTIYHPDGIESYRYPMTILEKARLGLDRVSLFLKNLFDGKSEQNIGIVDKSKISQEDLQNLNLVGTQIKSAIEVKNVSYSGFISKVEDPDMLQFRVLLVSDTEMIPATFQYSISKDKIFYFGINE